MLKDHLDSRIADIDESLKALIPETIDESWVLEQFGPTKWKYSEKAVQEAIARPAWDLLNRGGKRWRPALMELCCEAVGGKRSDTKDLLAIPEIIHNGTLMIDDIEDSSTLRRGKLAIHKIYGEDIAINAGNAMYFLPYLKLKNIEEKKRLKLLELIYDEMLRLHLGQGKDIYWHRSQIIPTEDEYLQMCAFKTGVLARLSAKMGAILGDGTEEQIVSLGTFAESIGVAFQIVDDILNIRPSEKWGKTIGDDITEGKITLLVIHTLKNAAEKDRQSLLAILRSKTQEKSKIKEAIQILERYGAIGYAKKIADRLVLDAWKQVKETIIDSDAKTLLKEFADYLIERDI
ncbi:polyprenyl synthetase [Candidatus Woesearchaeota archaeon CG11_big_fil_rev_8_21_14_0_20_43_8]|nr:MAG: polyprenyl synthetase [Candidatus Woesearchaeota archaeon CG11_big_fil_rev_8_21_14_0_20_43_8]PIO06866.1 MAG: polyprenyl synthetase [Candidatus Woesearchaeota archaeon CG08_land_8_20_14_0_20_43_7]